jgi:hypothetical protein
MIKIRGRENVLIILIFSVGLSYPRDANIHTNLKRLFERAADAIKMGADANDPSSSSSITSAQTELQTIIDSIPDPICPPSPTDPVLSESATILESAWLSLGAIARNLNRGSGAAAALAEAAALKAAAGLHPRAACPWSPRVWNNLAAALRAAGGESAAATAAAAVLRVAMRLEAEAAGAAGGAAAHIARR